MVVGAKKPSRERSPRPMQAPSPSAILQRRFRVGIACLLGAVWPGLALAQSLPAIESRRTTAAERGVLPAIERAAGTPALRTGTREVAAPSEAGGAEFGEQRIAYRRAHIEPWTAVVDLQVFRTDNAALTSTGKQSDWYMRYGAAVNYANRVAGPLFIDLSVQQSAFRYAEFDVLDFDLTRVEAGLLLQTLGRFDAFLFARYRLEYIAEAGLGSQLFTSHSIEAGLQKVWKITRGQRLYAGIAALVPLATDPEGAGRGEYSATVGYSLRLTEQINAGISYRGAWYHYTEGGREDWNHLLSLGASYDVADWLQLGLNVSYTLNRSSASRAEYESLVPGGSLALRVTF